MLGQGQTAQADKELLIRLHAEMLKGKRGALLTAARREH